MLYTMKDRETWTFGGKPPKNNKKENEKDGEKDTPKDSEKEKNHIVVGSPRSEGNMLPRIASITYDKNVGWYFKQEENGADDKCNIGA